MFKSQQINDEAQITKQKMNNQAIKKGKTISIQDGEFNAQQINSDETSQNKEKNSKQSTEENQNLQKQDENSKNKFNLCEKLSFLKQHKKLLIGVSIFVLLAIIIPIAIKFGTPQRQYKFSPNIDTGMITFRKKNIPVSSTVVNNQVGQSTTLLNMAADKIDSVQEVTEISTRLQVQAKQKTYQIIIPTLELIGSTIQSSKTQNKNIWLNNVRSLADKIRQKLSNLFGSTSTEPNKSKFILAEFIDKYYVDVQYIYDKQIFSVVKFDASSGQQQQQPKKNPQTKTQTSDSDTQKIVEQATQKFKKILNSNIDAIENKSNQIIQQQKQLIQNQENDDWKNTLLKQCRTIKSNLFRCPFEAAQKLDPSFKSTQLDPELKIITAFVAKIKRIAEQ